MKGSFNNLTSKSTKERIAAKLSKRVCVNGKEFESIRAAAKFLKCTPTHISYCLKHKKGILPDNTVVILVK
jgi:hypothetical protein